VTVFDQSEQFHPSSVKAFVLGSDLERLDGASPVVVDPDPKPGKLPSSGQYRLNFDGCSPTLPIGGLDCYAAATAGDTEDLVYGRAARTGDSIVLQYWYFYPDDVWSYEYRPSDFVWQAHEGDWEVVNVVLGPDRAPVEVGYSQHCAGQRRAWASVQRIGETHPVVHVARGSHANYFTPGVHFIAPACIPPAAQNVLRIMGLGPNVPDWHFPGRVSGPAGTGGDTTLMKVASDDTEGWLAFPGTWGEIQTFHSPLTLTVPFGTSPVGPAFHRVWDEPLPTLASWPVG
jgi:hypothetical protein